MRKSISILLVFIAFEAMAQDLLCTKLDYPTEAYNGTFRVIGTGMARLGF